MAGALLGRCSPYNSDDERGGGAPLYARSPATEDRRSEGGLSSVAAKGALKLAGDLAGNHEHDPRTPSDQNIQTPVPLKPQRSLSKSALRAAAENLPNQSEKSAGSPPANPNSAAFASGATLQRQKSLPLFFPLPVPSLPVAMAPSTQGRLSLPGSTTHSFVGAMQATILGAEEENLHPAQKNHRDQSCKLQSRIWGLRQGMHCQPSIPREFLTSFDYDVQELINNAARMNQAVDSLVDELKKAQADQQRVRSLEATIRELEGDVKDWKDRHEKAERTMASIAGRSDEDMRTIQFLKEQLRQNEVARTILQDQVAGKRNLWLNVHTDPKERAAALDTLARSSSTLSSQTFASPAHDDYAASARVPGSVQSGTTIQSNDVQSSNDRSLDLVLGNVHSGGFATARFPGGRLPFRGIPQSHSGPAMYHGPHRRLSNATATSAQSGSFVHPRSRYLGAPSSRPSTGGRRPPRVSTIAETGSPMERRRLAARSIVRAELEDEACVEWAEAFQSLFALIYGFSANYFHELPRINTDWRSHIHAEADSKLWDYMCSICGNSHERQRGEHALRLLRDRDSRPYLMQRLMVQHLLITVCGYEGWKGYSDDIDEELDRLEEDLNAVDSSKTYERQVFVDRRADLVKQILESDEAGSFTTYKLAQHHRFLKYVVSPFLSTDKGANVVREAHRDLFGIATMARELSTKLFRSRMTLQHVWSDTGARFTAETHEPLDCRVDRLTLQYEHCRIRLCATPVVTLRDDRGMAIKATNILKAGVLVMDY